MPQTDDQNLHPKFAYVNKRKVIELMDKKCYQNQDIVSLSNYVVSKRVLQNIRSDGYIGRTEWGAIVSLADVLGCSVNDLVLPQEESTTVQIPEKLLSDTGLSIGEIRFKASNKKLCEFFNEITEKLCRSERDHILLYMFPGLIERFGECIRFNGTYNNFQITMPSDYYPASLEGISAADCGFRIEAIAEPSDSIERPMWIDADPNKTLIARRLFLIPPELLMNSIAFNPILEMLQSQLETYPVCVGVARSGESFDHPLGSSAVGRNMIVMEPNLVGGYVEEGGETRLKIVSDTLTYSRARQVYEKQVKNSISLEKGMSSEDVRRAHVVKAKIGNYDPSWAGGGEKSLEYRLLYEENIRCFVPNYDRFIQYTMKKIQDQIIQQLRRTSHSLNILEVGPGTGGLTKPLTAWIDDLNNPCFNSTSSLFVGTFSCLEKSQLMLESLKRSLKGIKTYHAFLEGEYDDHIMTNLTIPQKYDVICGSLVLHDILGENPSEMIEVFLERSKRCLRPGGSLIFSDFFVESQDEIAEYIQDMKRVGMTDEQIENFLDLNPEMVHTVTKTQVETAAKKLGLRLGSMTNIPSFSKKPRPTRTMTVHYDVI